MNNSQLKNIFAQIRHLPEKMVQYRELILANLLMISEIPAPVFGEQQRIAFLEQRFTECGLHNCSTDEMGNGLAILPGVEGEKTTLLTAHADTPFSLGHNHNCRVEAGKIHGPGVADNNLGLAVLATLPTILDGLGISLCNDLLFMAATASLDHGNQGGLRFFLTNSERCLANAVSIEGAPLGRLQYRSMASLGAVISCQVDTKISNSGAIDVLSTIISRLHAIVLPEDDNTALVLGAINGGASYKIPARNSLLKFQTRSDSDKIVRDIATQIDAILDNISQQVGISVYRDEIAGTVAGGLDSNHPFIRNTRRIMTLLGVEPRQNFFSAVISGYVEHSIPALCIGMTNGENINYADEYLEIEPISRGVAQLIGILLIIDGGFDAEY